MIRSAATLAAVCFLFSATRANADDRPYRKLHEAIYNMIEAQDELSKAKNDFGGHKARAMRALDAAVVETKRALQSARSPYERFTPDRDSYRGYRDYPHLRHAKKEIAEARDDLKKAKIDFGGHRKHALAALDAANDEVNKCIEHLDLRRK